jgi:hypothetical protein
MFQIPWRKFGRVAMDDDRPERVLVVQELLPDPQQVLLGLPLQGDPRSYARVNEEIVAEAE